VKYPQESLAFVFLKKTTTKFMTTFEEVVY